MSRQKAKSDESIFTGKTPAIKFFHAHTRAEMVTDVAERMAALAQSEAIKSAQVALNLDAVDGPELAPAVALAKKRLAEFKVGMDKSSAAVEKLFSGASPALISRVIAKNDWKIQELQQLQRNLWQKVNAQIDNASEVQKELDKRVAEMAEAQHANLVAENTISVAEVLSTPLCSYIHKFFDGNMGNVQSVLMELQNNFSFGKDKKELGTVEAVVSHIKLLSNEQLLAAINMMLAIKPDKSDYGRFITKLREHLVIHLTSYPTYEFASKAKGGLLTYHPEKMIEQIRKDHQSRLDIAKKLLLEKVNVVGVVVDMLADYSNKISEFQKIFGVEASALKEMQKFSGEIDRYSQEVMKFLESEEIKHLHKLTETFFATNEREDGVGEKITSRLELIENHMDHVKKNLEKIHHIAKKVGNEYAQIGELDQLKERFSNRNREIEGAKLVLKKLVNETVNLAQPVVTESKKSKKIGFLPQKIKAFFLGARVNKEYNDSEKVSEKKSKQKRK